MLKNEHRLRIGIDAHYLDGFAQGVKTVVTNLLLEFEKCSTGHIYFAYHQKKHLGKGSLDNFSPVRHVEVLTNLGEFNQLIGFAYYALRDRLSVINTQYIAPILCPCPVVVTIFDILYERYPQYFPKRHRKILRFMCYRAARSARRIISGSEFTRSELIGRYKISEDRVVVIPCGVGREFRPLDPDETQNLLKILSIKKPYILFVGRIAQIKNIAGLLVAFKYLAERNSDFQLVLVGGRDNLFVEEGSAKILAAGQKWTKRVRFINEISDRDLVAMYNGAELFVLPSFGEGFGIPVLEAMACGTPVLSSNATSLPEVVGRAGWLFDPTNQDEFNDKLLTLISMPSERRRLSEAGKERVKLFSWEEAARKTIRVYEEAANNS